MLITNQIVSIFLISLLTKHILYLYYTFKYIYTYIVYKYISIHTYRKMLKHYIHSTLTTMNSQTIQSSFKTTLSSFVRRRFFSSCWETQSLQSESSKGGKKEKRNKGAIMTIRELQWQNFGTYLFENNLKHTENYPDISFKGSLIYHQA